MMAILFISKFLHAMTDLAATIKRSGLSVQTTLYTTHAWLVFFVISFIYLFFNWYIQTSVLTDQVYYYSLGAQVGAEKLSAFLDGEHRMSYLTYLMLPAIFLVKTVLVSFCLLTGLLLTSRSLPFSKLFRIVLFAETAFAAGTLFRLLILTFFHEVQSLSQYITFAPLSLYSLLDPATVPAWLIYPLQTLDVFQLGYVLLMAAGLQYYCRQPYKKMLYLVIGSYGIGLLCCMILVAFFTFSSN